jgi:hypothetical protein
MVGQICREQAQPISHRVPCTFASFLAIDWRSVRNIAGHYRSEPSSHTVDTGAGGETVVRVNIRSGSMPTRCFASFELNWQPGILKRHGRLVEECIKKRTSRRRPIPTIKAFAGVMRTCR